MRQLSLKTRLCVNLVVLTVSALALLTAILYFPIQAIYKDRVRDTLRRLASVAVLHIDGDQHATITDPAQEGGSDYAQMQSKLRAILAADPRLRFVYTMRVHDDGAIRFVVDSAQPDEIAHLGEVYATPGPVLKSQAANLQEPTAEGDFYTDKWGTFLTGYAPIRRSDGSIDGILGLDMEAGLVTAEGRPLLLALIGAFMLCAALAWWIGRIAGRRLFAPIAELTDGAQKLAAGHTQHRIAVHGNDELAQLSVAFNTMADHVESSQRALETRVERTSTELERASGLMQAIVDNAVEAIIAIDQNGTIQSYNTAAERLFGYSARDCIGNHVRVLLPEPWSHATNEDITNYLRQLSQSPIPPRRTATTRRRDGAEIPVEISLGRVTLKSGELYIGVVYDLSEKQKVDRMKKEFLSTVSHELRTPLTSIRGGIELVRSGQFGLLSDKAADLMRIADENVLRLGRLIDDLLDVEKLEAGKLKFRYDKVDPLVLANNAIEANSGYAARFGVRCVIDAAPACCDPIRADPDRALQILNNLLSNAIKFSPEGERVLLSVTSVPDGICFSVHDRGPGVPPQFHERIFQKFAQADSSDQRQQGGTGLGLNISKQLAEQMGGTIGFNSTPGRGAEFYVIFPRTTPLDSAGTDEAAVRL